LVVFAGIDWGGEHHQLCVVDSAGKKLTQLRVTHNVAGLADLDAELRRFGPTPPVAIERSEGLLVEHLQQAGHCAVPRLTENLGPSPRKVQDRCRQR
jgi:hypothetical protein